MEASSSRRRADEWVGAPMTRPICPMHGIREVPRQIEREGEIMIEFACPVEDCDHNWVVKRIRV